MWKFDLKAVLGNSVIDFRGTFLESFYYINSDISSVNDNFKIFSFVWFCLFNSIESEI
jgi:hypothetical protein